MKEDFIFSNNIGNTINLNEYAFSFNENENLFKTETLHYGWLDPESSYENYVYSRECYNKILLLLAKELNNVHNVKRSVRYWEIIIGAWLVLFVNIILDRYLCIKKLHSKYNPSKIDAVSEEILFVFRDFNDFISYLNNKNYNLFLFDFIHNYLSNNRNNYKDLQFSDLKKISKKNLFLNKIKNFYNKITNKISKYTFVCSYIPIRYELVLNLLLKQLPYFLINEVDESNIFDFEKRKKLNLISENSDEFLKLLTQILPLQIPHCYIERFRVYEKKAYELFPANNKAIFTSNAHFWHEPFKFWAASQTEQGVPLYISQHGGNYGIGKFSCNEEFERSIASKFITWGWGGNLEKAIHLPSLKLKAFAKKAKSNNKNTKIILVSLFLPKFSYSLISFPFSSRYFYYLDDQKLFVQNLDSEVVKHLTARIPNNDYGWGLKSKYKLFSDEISFESADEILFFKSVSQARIIVTTYNGTTLLETLCANVPTIIFWDIKYSEIRDSAAPFFEELKSVGIFHDSPISAALFLNKVYENPSHWWQSNSVQTVIKNFCNRFAFQNANPLQEWVNFFKNNES
ncbi:MAG: LIC12162 family protein [Silvanigrellaceae bacterium]|nr:LIC12162 family protein [Silvanigrellaceae bacterium]